MPRVILIEALAEIYLPFRSELFSVYCFVFCVLWVRWPERGTKAFKLINKGVAALLWQGAVAGPLNYI